MLSQLSEFEGWSNYARETKQTKDLADDGIETSESLKDAIFYLQENYVVTEGIYIDENIIFEHVTQEWKDFCTKKLKFEIPIYEALETS